MNDPTSQKIAFEMLVEATDDGAHGYLWDAARRESVKQAALEYARACGWNEPPTLRSQHSDRDMLRLLVSQWYTLRERGTMLPPELSLLLERAVSIGLHGINNPPDGFELPALAAERIKALEKSLKETADALELHREVYALFGRLKAEGFETERDLDHVVRAARRLVGGGE